MSTGGKGWNDVDSKAKKMSDAILRDEPEEGYRDKLLFSSALVVCEFTRTNVNFQTEEEGPCITGKAKKYMQLVRDLADVLQHVPQRRSCFSLFFHQNQKSKTSKRTYALQFWYQDHDLRQRVILEDCFGANLSKLIVIVGVLTYCDEHRLGFIDCFTRNKMVKNKQEWNVTLDCENAEAMKVPRGDKVTFTLKEKLTGKDHTYSKATTVFSAVLKSETSSSEGFFFFFVVKLHSGKWH